MQSKILTSKSQNYLSKHLTPITPLITKSNSLRTGFARVLTSNECLAILEEQRLTKKQEAEEKERRKLEREKKRKEKEEEMKRKREEREERLKQRKATKSKPPAKKRKMATDRNCSATPATATGSIKPSTQPLTTSTVHTDTPTSTEEPVQKKRKFDRSSEETPEEIDDWVCSFCFGNHADDDGTE